MNTFKVLCLAMVALLFAPMAMAQTTTTCICTTGCTLVSDPFPQGAADDQPTHCEAFNGTTSLGRFPVVLASSLAGKVSSCSPATAPYPVVTGTAVACSMTLTLPPARYNVTAIASNAAGVSPASAPPFVFDSIAPKVAPVAPRNIAPKR